MISAETVTHTWQQLSVMPDDQALELVQQMSREQPALFVYLITRSGRRSLDEREGQLCFYVGLAVWQVMKQSPRRLRKVTRATLEQAEQVNEEFLDLLATDTAADSFSAMQTMFENYPEPEVFDSIVKILMDDADYAPDDPPLRDENRGLALMHLKVILDTLIGSRD